MEFLQWKTIINLVHWFHFIGAYHNPTIQDWVPCRCKLNTTAAGPKDKTMAKMKTWRLCVWLPRLDLKRLRNTGNNVQPVDLRAGHSNLQDQDPNWQAKVATWALWTPGSTNEQGANGWDPPRVVNKPHPEGPPDGSSPSQLPPVNLSLHNIEAPVRVISWTGIYISRFQGLLDLHLGTFTIEKEEVAMWLWQQTPQRQASLFPFHWSFMSVLNFSACFL